MTEPAKAKPNPLTINLTNETMHLLNSVTNEIFSIYWEKFQNKDDVIAYLISYYYKK